MSFKVGDKVRVKSKEELEKLFEKNATIDGDGDWNYEYKLSDGSEEDIYFISNMKAACEEVATIVSVDKEFESYELEFEHKVFSDEDEYLFIEDWLERTRYYVEFFDEE